VEDITKSKMP